MLPPCPPFLQAVLGISDPYIPLGLGTLVTQIKDWCVPAFEKQVLFYQLPLSKRCFQGTLGELCSEWRSQVPTCSTSAISDHTHPGHPPRLIHSPGALCSSNYFLGPSCPVFCVFLSADSDIGVHDPGLLMKLTEASWRLCLNSKEFWCFLSNPSEL